MINNDTITSMMTDTETFRQKVIDAGIRGKLTEQRSEDGNAEDLYQQIQEEKAKLVKEGKIKKSKPLPSIKPEEIPFEIPENWKWVRLGDLFDHNTGKALNSSDKDGSLLTYITTSNVYWDHFELNNLKSMYFNESEIDKCTIQKGDLLICEGGDIGRSAIWPYKQEIRIQNHLHRLRPFLSEVNAKFYYYVMWSYKLNGLINGRGIGLQGFSSKRVHSLIVPFPSSTEQERIVNRIDEILDTQKRLAQSLEEYSSNVEALKSKVIDAGIQGKLTEQLPVDGNAEDLYQQIQTEKAKLVKEGKIKKSKPLPPIKPEEIPFEIPKNWKWIRFAEIYTLTNGVASRGTIGGTQHSVLRLADLTSDEIHTYGIRKISLSDSEYESHRIQKNDLIIVRVNGSRERVGSVYCYLNEEAISYCDHLFCAHTFTAGIEPEYIMLAFKTEMARKQLDPLIKTTAGQNTISQGNIGKLMIPIPPHREQIRIIDKVHNFLVEI